MTRLPLLLGVTVLCAACTMHTDPAAHHQQSTGPGMAATTTPTTTARPSKAAAIKDWEAVAGDHFRESGAALEQVREASSAEDEAALRAGCTRLHDTNAIGLQADLPTPDRRLTDELQQMIDDMNAATHACLRFALVRDPMDADTYQQYLSRAVEHLQRAKVLLNTATK